MKPYEVKKHVVVSSTWVTCEWRSDTEMTLILDPSDSFAVVLTLTEGQVFGLRDALNEALTVEPEDLLPPSA